MNTSEKKKNNVGGILYLIGKAGEKGFPFRIRLQKMALLGKIESGFPFDFEYSSYFYGPYASALQDVLNELIENDFVEEENREVFHNQYGYYYSLTEKGKELLKNIALPKVEVAKLDGLYEKYHRLSTGALVKEAKAKSGIKSIGE